MRVEFEFFATVREAMGEKRVVRDVPRGTTVGEALRSVLGEHDASDLVFDGEGRFRSHVNVLRNDESLGRASGPDEPLQSGDQVTVAPGVAGG